MFSKSRSLTWPLTARMLPEKLVTSKKEPECTNSSWDTADTEETCWPALHVSDDTLPLYYLMLNVSLFKCKVVHPKMLLTCLNMSSICYIPGISRRMASLSTCCTYTGKCQISLVSPMERYCHSSPLEGSRCHFRLIRTQNASKKPQLSSSRNHCFAKFCMETALPFLQTPLSSYEKYHECQLFV